MIEDRCIDIILYSTGCPLCEMLKSKLVEKGIPFIENNSKDEMLALGITRIPVLSVDGQLMELRQAVDWVNKQ